MKESDLYVPVRDWMVARGYEIHVEMFDADIIAMKDGKITVVGLKPCLTTTVIKQCVARAGWADFVYAAIASEPRGIGGMRGFGFGLLMVSGSSVRQRLLPRPQPWLWHKRRNYRIKKLTNRSPAQPHELAGLPACPELRLQRQAREERR